VTARVDHALSPEDLSPSKKPLKPSGTANRELKEMVGPSCASEWGALTSSCRPSSGAQMAVESVPVGYRGRSRTTANAMGRRVSYRDWRESIDMVSKMQLENRAKNIRWHVFFQWVAAGALPIQPNSRLNTSNSQSLEGLENKTFSSWCHRTTPREKKR
jgi:hypothetical protein